MSAPVLVTVVLSHEQAAALWADATWTGKLSGPAYTIQAIVQAIVEAAADKAVRFFSGYPAEMERAKEGFTAAHASLPSPEPAPETVIVVNLPGPACR